MNIYDCHLHSSFSFDSSQNIEEYIALAKSFGATRFITTEHMDLESHFDNFADIVPDFELQQKTLSRLGDKYGIDVLFGVEVGWRKDIHKRNLEIINKYPFDMVILSVHESDYCDVSFPKFRQGKTTDQCYNEYLELVYNGVTACDNFDTLGHIDYVLRYAGHTDMNKHHDMLEKILKVLIEKNKALEINTKLFPQKQAVERYEYVLDLYTSLGGEKVTVGSDGHIIKYYKNCFDDALKMIKKSGIDSICVFKNRKEEKILL